MRIFRAAVTALAIALTPVIAAAQDMSRWDGFYAGVQGSSGEGKMNYLLANGFVYNREALSGSSRGVFVGHLWTTGSFAYGAEVEFGQPDFTLSRASYTFLDSVDLKARAGYAFGPTLLYGVLGYGSANWRESETYPLAMTGILAGVGVEQLLGDHVFVGGEVLRRSLKENYPLAVMDPIRTDLTTFSVRLGTRF